MDQPQLLFHHHWTTWSSSLSVQDLRLTFFWTFTQTLYMGKVTAFKLFYTLVNGIPSYSIVKSQKSYKGEGKIFWDVTILKERPHAFLYGSQTFGTSFAS